LVLSRFLSDEIGSPLALVIGEEKQMSIVASKESRKSPGIALLKPTAAALGFAGTLHKP